MSGIENERFGAYRVDGTLGAGALSTIYRAVQEPLGRVVAIKALKSEIAPTSSFGGHLDREAKILADLVHPNVVLLLEAGRTPAGRPYVVLEHVDGPSLDEVLRALRESKTGRRKTLGVPAALAIATSVCAALEHIHERGVVHRDVKPSNVLLARSGIVKVIDFGIAQRPRIPSMSDAFGSEGITMSGRMAPEQIKDAFGTPAYMSPEQILGDFVDGRSDLFGLGVVLYEALSGVRPFESAKDDGKRGSARIRRDAAPPLRERAPHVPRAVERIVMRLLEKSPNDRYPSASAVKERLETALRAETREDPSAIVRQALVTAGFSDSAELPARESSTPPAAPALRAKTEADAIDDRPRRPRPRPRGASGGIRRAIGIRGALLGFAAIGGVFALVTAAVEAPLSRTRESRSLGALPLPLAPEHGGGLRVLATPWAHVRIDGQQVETTPFARTIPLLPGRHWVTLTHPEAAPVERAVDIVAGETLVLDVTMDLGTEDGGKDAR